VSRRPQTDRATVPPPESSVVPRNGYPFVRRFAAGGTSATLGDVAETYRSGDALFAYDTDLTVIAWNGAAEVLTGITADDAVGRPCWDVLHGVTERGAVICHPGCATARLARAGWPVSCSEMIIVTASGHKRVSVSTIGLHSDDGPSVILNLLQDVTAPPPTPRAAERLTVRQVEVLRLLAEGAQAKAIAARLGIAETTARNHIAGVLRRLGCHSQLEAVAVARRSGLI
jgi:DNA-binding CsgD family transcriptional regulator